MKKRIMFAISGLIVFILALLGGYTIERKIAISNNEVLMAFEQHIPISYQSINRITYYEYDLKNGKVIYQYEPAYIVVVKDDKRGFAKEYRNHVLRSVMDLKTAKIYKLLSQYYPLQRIVRSDEECDIISKLLDNKEYEKIKDEWGGKIVTTQNGTIFVS